MFGAPGDASPGIAPTCRTGWSARASAGRGGRSRPGTGPEEAALRGRVVARSAALSWTRASLLCSRRSAGGKVKSSDSTGRGRAGLTAPGAFEASAGVSASIAVVRQQKAHGDVLKVTAARANSQGVAAGAAGKAAAPALAPGQTPCSSKLGERGSSFQLARALLQEHFARVHVARDGNPIHGDGQVRAPARRSL